MFYVMMTHGVRNACTVAPDQDQAYDPWALFRGEYQLDGPLRLHHAMGRKPGDVLDCTDAVSWIVSDRVVHTLQAQKVTGWSTYPVIVYGKNGIALAGYSGLSVVGRSGPLDDSRQRIEVRKSPFNPDYSYRVGRGLFFDMATWDGSEIFTPHGGLLFTVQRVKDVLEKEKIKELSFQDIRDYESDLGPA